MKHYRLALLLLAHLCLFCGCNGVRTDPLPAFRQVQNDIECRTGNRVEWTMRGCRSDFWEAYIQEILQEDLTEEKAVYIALLHNPRLQATYQKLGIAQAEVVQAGLLANPLLNANPRYHKKFGSGPYVLELELVQDFLDFLLKPLRKKTAVSELEKTKREVEASILDVIAETKIAFHSYSAKKALWQVSRENLEAAESLNEVSNRMLDAGNITKLSQLAFRTQWGQAEIDAASAELDIQIAKEKLIVLFGLTQCLPELKIAHEVPNIEYYEQEEECECAAIANSLDLAIARLNIKTAALKLGIELTEQVFQELTVGAHSEREESGKWFVGPDVTVSIPIFDIGQAKRAANKAEMRMLFENYQAEVLEIRSAARTVFRRYHNWASRKNYVHDVLLPLAEETTNETLLQYNAMQLGVLDLLKAKQMEYEIRKQLTQIVLEYQIAKAELEQILSGRKPE